MELLENGVLLRQRVYVKGLETFLAFEPYESNFDTSKLRKRKWRRGPLPQYMLEIIIIGLIIANSMVNSAWIWIILLATVTAIAVG